MSERYRPSPDRYQGQPFLKLIDSYVLWVIGVLNDDSTAALEAMTPKFLESFGMDHGTWQDVVKLQMDFDEDYIEWLRTRWQRAVDSDLAAGRQSDPLAWAHATVDFIVRDETPTAS